LPLVVSRSPPLPHSLSPPSPILPPPPPGSFHLPHQSNRDKAAAMQEKRNRTLSGKGAGGGKGKTGAAGGGSGASSEGGESSGDGTPGEPTTPAVLCSTGGGAGGGASGATGAVDVAPRVLTLVVVPVVPVVSVPTALPTPGPSSVTTPPRRGRRRAGGHGVSPKTRLVVVTDWADGAVAAVEATGGCVTAGSLAILASPLPPPTFVHPVRSQPLLCSPPYSCIAWKHGPLEVVHGMCALASKVCRG
jgi:hypothetical protein